ncbi:hypothetical protein [Desulfosporosinus sp. FKA]|uniref:hypothetical protein n=1 Tax=Desulfosporosinus sp. FKA TaxID=1969834 RepID=UPI000B49FA58|nr:hypothetical protein [Desulfosporosinus sp. FKA]
MNQENYYALALSIIGGYLPETSFAKLASPHPDLVKRIILPEDLTLMKRYRKQGLTYKQIGDIFGLGMDVVYARIKRNVGNKRMKEESAIV